MAPSTSAPMAAACARCDRPATSGAFLKPRASRSTSTPWRPTATGSTSGRLTAGCLSMTSGAISGASGATACRPPTSLPSPCDRTRLSSARPAASLVSRSAALSEAEASMRAFLALDPDPSARAALCRYRRRLLQAPWSRHVKWVAEASLHLTIRFLGEVDAAALTALTARLEAALEQPAALGAVELSLTEPRFFPSARQPRAIACLVAAPPALLALAALAEAAARAAGLAARDRPFHGHVTLGRTRPAWPSGTRLGFPPEQTAWRADALTLYRSDLLPDGPRYAELRRFPLTSGTCPR
ncbi:MAG: RNA 2',3'-cyclic phosphodiesterase [Chloracidobacterium sp. CP2_5A]|nr:MAG: RNA 2',3'-cyclic phosphodiesterase [Chloracidobacterium sp. CP2_5A]